VTSWRYNGRYLQTSEVEGGSRHPSSDEAKWREASAAAGGSGIGKLGCSHIGCTQADTEERACPVFGAATGAIFSPILFSF